jgi:hypothetical protein
MWPTKRVSTWTSHHRPDLLMRATQVGYGLLVCSSVYLNHNPIVGGKLDDVHFLLLSIAR